MYVVGPWRDTMQNAEGFEFKSHDVNWTIFWYCPALLSTRFHNGEIHVITVLGLKLR